MSETDIGFQPSWPAPAKVGAFITCRGGGFSREPYASNNLGLHVGDDPEAVMRNREQLVRRLGIQRPFWLEQVHGTEIVEVGDRQPVPRADASISHRPGSVCAVLTADCLPLLLCDRAGRQVAAVHCGWRGLANGIVAKSVDRFSAPPQDLMAYLGPAISGRHYEVGEEVREALARTVPESNPKFSHAVAGKPGHYLADLYAAARTQLQVLGCSEIYGGDRCTYAEAKSFFSYRRDGVTGRMVSLIWLK